MVGVETLLSRYTSRSPGRRSLGPVTLVSDGSEAVSPGGLSGQRGMTFGSVPTATEIVAMNNRIPGEMRDFIMGRRVATRGSRSDGGKVAEKQALRYDRRYHLTAWPA